MIISKLSQGKKLANIELVDMRHLRASPDTNIVDLTFMRYACHPRSVP